MAWHQRTHWRILVALGLGIVYGVLAALAAGGGFTGDWIAPFGTIFMRLLLLIAVPLVLASLVTGVASLADLQKLSPHRREDDRHLPGDDARRARHRSGPGQPGTARRIDSESLRTSLQETYQGDLEDRQEAIDQAMEAGPLQPLVDMVPENILGAATNNRAMLSVVFVAFLLGVALMQLPRARAQPLLDLFESLNAVIIAIVGLILKVAPLGVFALIAGTITTVAGDDPADVAQLLGALGLYSITVLVGLAIHAFLTYPLLLQFCTPVTPLRFLRGIAPAQLVAFSTSSSAATLPVTMERAEHDLGVSEEVASFALPLGATINMDGTAVYMSVAAVFIAQTLGIPLGVGAQATIVFTALLASIGTAAVPSAGIVMLVIVLEAVGVPPAGIALIFGVDRILDMCRTATNVTGDAAVATVVAASEGQLSPTAVNGLPAGAGS